MLCASLPAPSRTQGVRVVLVASFQSPTANGRVSSRHMLCCPNCHPTMWPYSLLWSAPLLASWQEPVAFGIGALHELPGSCLRSRFTCEHCANKRLHWHAYTAGLSALLESRAIGSQGKPLETMWNAGSTLGHHTRERGYALACTDGSLSVRAYRLTQAGAEKWLRRMVSLICLAGAMYKLAACSVSPPQEPCGSPFNIPPASVVHPGQRDSTHDL